MPRQSCWGKRKIRKKGTKTRGQVARNHCERIYEELSRTNVVCIIFKREFFSSSVSCRPQFQPAVRPVYRGNTKIRAFFQRSHFPRYAHVRIISLLIAAVHTENVRGTRCVCQILMLCIVFLHDFQFGIYLPTQYLRSLILKSPAVSVVRSTAAPHGNKSLVKGELFVVHLRTVSFENLAINNHHRCIRKNKNIFVKMKNIS